MYNRNAHPGSPGWDVKKYKQPRGNAKEREHKGSGEEREVQTEGSTHT